MRMDQAKWYVLYFNNLFSYWNNDLYKTEMKRLFDQVVFIMLLVSDHGFKRGTVTEGKITVFCGKKKLKKLIIEANLLGLEDSLIIFERK